MAGSDTGGTESWGGRLHSAHAEQRFFATGRDLAQRLTDESGQSVAYRSDGDEIIKPAIPLGQCYFDGPPNMISSQLGTEARPLRLVRRTGASGVCSGSASACSSAASGVGS